MKRVLVSLLVLVVFFHTFLSVVAYEADEKKPPPVKKTSPVEHSPLYTNRANAYERNRESDKKFMAQQAVKSLLKDPRSAEFRDVSVNGDFVCGSVNARNSFGGYAGDTRFISNGHPGATFLHEVANNNSFTSLWDELCTSK